MAILEVGLGGRLDATNIVPHPVVCGVTSLGYDHMELLGYTLRVSLPSRTCRKHFTELTVPVEIGCAF